jgi:RNA polymerase sigma-70 factor (subfamily 1)
MQQSVLALALCAKNPVTFRPELSGRKESETMDIPNDRETIDLIHRACERDAEAWNLLVLRHTTWLQALARQLLDGRLRARFDPEDIVQETFTDAFLKLEEFFKQPTSFRAWLRQRLKDRVHRIHRDHLDTERRSVRREAGLGRRLDGEISGDLVAYLQDSMTSPSGRAMRVEDGQVLEEAFHELSETDREILALYFIERRAHSEIEAILHLRPNTVTKRLSRATQHFAELLRRSHREWCDAFETTAQRRV